MAETPVHFTTRDQVILEGLFSEGSSGRGAVIAHPHPLYGGDMRNIVVETLQNAYARNNHATLRFNFRGVGKSCGTYDDGEGEQTDIAGAMDFLRQKGITAIDLAGYSFGCWVIAQTPEKHDAAAIVLVSPPAALLAFDPAAPLPNLKLVVTGERDEFAPPNLLKNLMPQWNPDAEFQIIPGADHFYFGFTDRLKKILATTK